jgi:deoxyribodipyrimidine photolyase-related protein
MNIFVLFPMDLYSDISYLRDCRVLLVEHDRFFDRYSQKKGNMRLNILKPIYHRASMRYYNDFLKSKKIDVEYVDLKIRGGWINHIKLRLKELLSENNYPELKFFDPTDRIIESELHKNFSEYTILDTPRFILTTEDLESYNTSKKTLRQTSFYKWMRDKTQVLMDKKGKVEGGKLTYDTDNRKPPYKDMGVELDKKSHVAGLKGEPDISTSEYIKSATQYVMSVIPESHLRIWDGSYLDLKKNKYDIASVGLELRFPIDHSGAKARLTYFIKHKLDKFGDYQDAILAPIKDDTDNTSSLRSFLYHSGISVLVNVGLLTPQDVIDSIISYYNKSRKKPHILPDVEGFIRQILGWREFSRYCYEFESDKYLNKNYFRSNNKLDRSWYTGSTDIKPVDDAIEKAFRFGYLHHIERLMIISNFMVLSSINPVEMFKWFTEFSLDSYDWVMEYNIYVMGSYSDGGNFTTKPYISSSNYIMKMSDYQIPGNQEVDTIDSKLTWVDTWDLMFWQFMKKHKKKIKKINRLSMLLKYADKNIKKIKQH